MLAIMIFQTNVIEVIKHDCVTARLAHLFHDLLGETVTTYGLIVSIDSRTFDSLMLHARNFFAADGCVSLSGRLKCARGSLTGITEQGKPFGG